MDFKKAFDSVWHDGLLNKLLQINVGVFFNNVIKSFYHNSSRSIKIAKKQTRSFYHDPKQNYEIASINCLYTILHFMDDENQSQEYYMVSGITL